MNVTYKIFFKKWCNTTPSYARQSGHWLWQWKKLISTMMESPPLPLPTLYCISQASPIMGFTLRPVTRGGGPAPLLTMAPWGPKRLRCCTVSMPPPPATPPSSTYTARINLRTQVCISASISSTFLEFSVWFMTFIPCRWSNLFFYLFTYLIWHFDILTFSSCICLKKKKWNKESPLPLKKKTLNYVLLTE